MMQNIEVYNDFFTEELHKEIHQKLIRPQWSPTGGNNSSWFWHMDNLEKEEYFSEYLYNIICDKIERRYDVRRIYANGQSCGQCGNPHTDDGDITFLYFPNPTWKLTYQGHLIFCENAVGDPTKDEPTHIIGYKPNRAILFPAKIIHYADAPHRYYNGFRISLAYKFLT